MASVNQTRPHCVNQIEKTHSKPSAARHGTGTVWARYAMCELALRDWTKAVVACLGVLTFGETKKSLRYIPYTGPVPKYFLDTNQQRCRNVQNLCDHSRTIPYDIPTAARI